MSGEASGRPKRNCFGLFQGLGNLEILAGGNPVSAKASGCDGAGWDWRRFEGTTVPQLPLEELDKGWTSISMTIDRPKPSWAGSPIKAARAFSPWFVNQAIMPGEQDPQRKKELVLQRRPDPLPGLRHLLRRGASILRRRPSARNRLRNNEQRRVPPHLAWMGRTSRLSRRSERLTRPSPTGSSMFSRPATTCPRGRTSRVARKHQTSRDVNDLEDTEGDFLTAWIDHGKAPKRRKL